MISLLLILVLILKLFSFWAWGAWMNRRGLAPNDHGMRMVLGVALYLVYGSLLNLAGWIHWSSMLIFDGLGLILAFLQIQKHDWRLRVKTQWTALLGKGFAEKGLYLFSGASLLAVMAVGIFANHRIDSDDTTSYLFYVERMLQTGALGNDPFNSTRLATSFGGFYFLQWTFYGIAGDAHILFADRVLGPILIVFLILAWVKQQQLQSWVAPLVLIVLFLSPVPYNSQSSYCTMAFYIAIFRLCLYHDQSDDLSLKASVLLAMVLSACCSLKATSYFPIGCFFIGFALILMWKFRVKALAFLGLTALFSSLFLFPWMLSLYQSSGTWLYPILGSGYANNIAEQGANLMEVQGEKLAHIKFFLLKHHMVYLFVLLLFDALFSGKKISSRLLYYVFAMTAILNVVVLLHFMGAIDTIGNYNSPYFKPAFAFLLVLCFAQSPAFRDDTSWSRAMFAALCLGLIFFNSHIEVYSLALAFAGLMMGIALSKSLRWSSWWIWLIAILYYILALNAKLPSIMIARSYLLLAFALLIFICFRKKLNRSVLEHHLKLLCCFVFIFFINFETVRFQKAVAEWNINLVIGQDRLAVEQERYKKKLREAQTAIPEYTKALGTVNMAYQFDMQRNTIYNYFNPGFVSPPPGLPLESSLEELKTYLEEQSVEYLIFEKYHWFLFREHDINSDQTGKYLPSLKRLKRYKALLEEMKAKDGAYFENDLFLVLKV